MSVQQTIESLVSAIRLEKSSDWKRKAKIIGAFADSLSDQIVTKLKIDPEALYFSSTIDESGDRSPWNSLGPDAPSDILLEIQLEKVSSSLQHDEEVEVMLFFCPGRVIDFNNITRKPRRIMTYEECARFIVFWYAEKIIQIIRKNNYDRVASLVDLYDRLAAFIAT